MIGLFENGPRVSAVRGVFTILLACGLIVLASSCGKDKEIIRYRDRPNSVIMISPPVGQFITANNPTFIWHSLNGADHYQLQVCQLSDFVSNSINTQLAETTYASINPILNSTYYWRVRARNLDGEWGDWSDADIWTFLKSDYVNYFDLISMTETMGIPQDIYIRNDTAYVADGQADLTIYDVSNPADPMMLRNIDTNDDDFAKGAFVAPSLFAPDSFPYVYVADMDGKIQALNARDTTFLLNLSFGTDQNLEDVTGIVLPDSDGIDKLWILAVSSGFNRRKLSFYKMLYDQTPPNPYTYFYQMDMPADAMGLCVDTNYVYVACGTSGLRIVDIRDIYNPLLIGASNLAGTSLSVDVEGNYAYVAADRAGLYVVDITDRSNPVVVDTVNTSGRTKDVQILGNYAFIADADGGLKVVDISNPAQTRFLAAYATPYAYGLYVTADNIYLCDRDYGLMIFENRIAR